MTLDLEELSAEDFERRLIASSQLDRLEAPNVENAWHRFVSLTSSVGVSAGSLSGVHRVREPHTETGAPSGAGERSDAPNLGAPHLDAPNLGAANLGAANLGAANLGAANLGAETAGPLTAPLSSVRWVALKWGALGTITGALLAGGVLRIAQPEPPLTVPSAPIERVGTAGSPRPVAQTLGSEAPTPRAPLTQVPMTATSSTQTSAAQTLAPHAPEGAAASARVAVPHESAPKVIQEAGQERSPNADEARAGRPRVHEASSLAAEVRLVDSARHALQAGNLSAAHDLIQAYRRKFPNGALTADVAYVEIKVAKAQGKDNLWRSQAQRFLATFPSDPHHQQVLELVNNAN